MESGGLLVGAPSYLDVLVSSSQPVDQLQLQHPPADLPPDLNDSAAQSAVTYATVLICDLKREQPPLHLHDKDWCGGGNFSSNSNISRFFPGGLWELDCRPAGETNAPRRSCSDNSMEEPSKTSEQEDEEEKAREEKDLCCLTDYPAAEEGSREEKTNIKLLKNVDFNREEESEESHALLGPEDSSEPLSASTQSVPLLYLPQLRSAPCTMHLTARPWICDSHADRI